MVRLTSLLLRPDRRVVLAAELLPDPDDGSEGIRRYVDLSSVAPDAATFLETGDRGLRLASDLVLLASSSSSSSSSSASSSSSSSPSSSTDGRGTSALIIPPTDVIKILPPLDPPRIGKFLCVGMNYADHCAEQDLPIPIRPVIFSKLGSSVIGPGDPIRPPPEFSSNVDYEVELGAVMGRTTPRNVGREDAMRYVGGYTVVNDVSARDLQLDADRNGGQWLLGKFCDSFAPLGPVIVTADEMPLDVVSDLGIRCRVNGTEVQNGSTSRMCHGVDEIVSYLSRFVTLRAGDVISTGTPPGVGCFRDPPVWLRDGDVVECEIDRIGTLVNPVEIARTTTTTTTDDEGER